MDFEHILAEHFKKYPEMLCDDMLKLAYQSEFGCGHMIRSPEESLEKIYDEFQTAKRSGFTGEGSPVEDIGNGFCRIYLSACDRISPELLNKMFVYSANLSGGSPEGFYRKKDIAKEFAFTVFDSDYTDKFFFDYDKVGNISPVSHSRTYKDAYHPAYRVVLAGFGMYFDIFERIEKLLSVKKSGIITIDGGACSGKSFLAELISGIFRLNVIHTDDFFLPRERKTPERMGEPGGNFDRERFYESVISKLGKGEDFSYRPYDCRSGSLLGSVKVKADRPVLIEGSYCGHTDFGRYADLSVFLDTDENLARERLLKREPPEKLEKFENIWIPAEKLYFSRMNVKARCDIISDGTISV